MDYIGGIKSGQSQGRGMGVSAPLQGEGRWFESSSAYQKNQGNRLVTVSLLFFPSIIIYTVTNTI